MNEQIKEKLVNTLCVALTVRPNEFRYDPDDSLIMHKRSKTRIRIYHSYENNKYVASLNGYNIGSNVFLDKAIDDYLVVAKKASQNLQAIKDAKKEKDQLTVILKGISRKRWYFF